MECNYVKRVALIFGLVLLATYSYTQTDDVVVQIPNGKLRGLILQTRKGRNVFTFYGVRYGQPPTGEDRFKPPKPAEKWKGVYNATVAGQACMQSNPSPNLTVSEDCLFLDVYSADLNASKPVIVFIHGGTFLSGSKSKASYEYLLDKEVVLVSINYRLDTFGYFSTGTKYASGNQGFKDQNLAMRWVRDNIKYFGGNPDLITLSGQSAGAMSVTLHMLSPQSYRLFHRAIAMSGAAVGHLESNTRNTSQFVLEKTNCNKANVAQAIKCLQNVPAEKILEVTSGLLTVFPWYYDIESESDEEPFITELPVDTARKGHIQNIPLMTGMTNDELYYKAYLLLKQYPLISLILSLFYQSIFPKALLYSNNPNKTEISKQLYSYYLNGQRFTMKNAYSLGELISDGILNHGIHRMMEYTRKVSNVYYYRMDYQGRYSRYYYDDGKPLGVLHEDDLQYMVVFKEIAPVLSVNDPENPTIERITSWWSKFAETGDPNDHSNNWTNAVRWSPCTKHEVNSLYLNESYHVSSEPFKDRQNLWDSLFPTY